MSVASPVIDYIDAPARRIYLLAGITEYHPVEDIYKEVRNLRRTDESLRSYDLFVSAGGNLPKDVAGTERTPRYAIFHNCQVVVSGDTYVSGEQLYADATGALVGKGKDCIDRALSPVDAYLDYAPPEAEVIVVATGSAVTEQDKADIAQQVWARAEAQYLTTVVDTTAALLTDIDATLDIKEAMRIVLSALAGKVAGADSALIRFRDLEDTKDVITATVDPSNGNRYSVTLDVS